MTELSILQNHSNPNMTAIKQLEDKIALWLEQDDIKWRQRAKRNWYRLGDKNTKFFYACALQRRRTNKIYSIKNNQGHVIHWKG